jgi:hypothetical protein
LIPPTFFDGRPPWPSSRGTTTGSTGGGSRWATRSTTSPSSSAGTLVAQRCSRRTQVWTPPPPSPERTGPQAVPTGCSAGTPSGVCTDHRMRTRAAYGSTAAALRHVVELQNTFRLDRFFLRDTLPVDPSGAPATAFQVDRAEDLHTRSVDSYLPALRSGLWDLGTVAGRRRYPLRFRGPSGRQADRDRDDHGAGQDKKRRRRPPSS